MSLVSLDPIDNSVLIFVLPKNTVVESIYGFGEYKIEALVKLGALENLGTKILSGSVGQLFGWHIYTSSVINIDSAAEKESRDWLKQVSISLLKQGVMKPLLLADSISFFRQVGDVRGDKIRVINLKDTSVMEKVLDRGGSEVFLVDKDRLDGLIERNYSSKVYAEEGLDVAVINTTGEAGLGSKFSRLLFNSGVVVVSVDDDLRDLEKSLILTNEKALKTGLTGKLISLFLNGPEWKITDTSSYRADVVILVGKDYWQYLNKKPI